METGILKKKIELLSAEQKLAVAKYADSLIESNNKRSIVAEPEVIYKTKKKSGPGIKNKKESSLTDDRSATEKPKLKREFGSLKGFVKYMDDDFDKPLDEFREYM
jgi:hypothetical protein